MWLKSIEVIHRFGFQTLFKRNDHFARLDHTHFAPHHFLGQIAVGMARIEQGNTVGQLTARSLDPYEFGLPVLQLTRIIAPCQRAIWAEQGIAAKEGYNDQCRCRRSSGAQVYPEGSRFSHEPLESQPFRRINPAWQQKYRDLHI